MQDFLEDHPELDPRVYLDKKENNILHHLSFHDQKELLKVYVKHTRKFIEGQQNHSRHLYQKDAKQ